MSRIFPECGECKVHHETFSASIKEVLYTCTGMLHLGESEANACPPHTHVSLGRELS